MRLHVQCHNYYYDVDCQYFEVQLRVKIKDVTIEMSLSIVLDEIEPWLLAAVASGGILLITLIVLFVRSRRKHAKPEEKPILFLGPYVEPPIWFPGPWIEPPSQKSFIDVRSYL